MLPSDLFIGFDFYGAGNVGDDLMLRGFFDAWGSLSATEFSCALPESRIGSQKLRFDQVQWIDSSTDSRASIVPQFGHWLGIGGTPFQASGGPWLLNQISADFDMAPGQQRFMIGVGCESEVLDEFHLAKDVATKTCRIWARDQASYDLLVSSLGLSAEKIKLGADLAHIYLSRVFPTESRPNKSGGKLGLVYYEDGAQKKNSKAVKEFVKSTFEPEDVVFFANDVREKQQELSLYKSMFGFFKGRYIGAKPRFFMPDYAQSNIDSLVSHYSSVEVVMAARYHALLTAAWAGCRVAALDRSSKIRALAAELQIPLIESPFTVQSLRRGFDDARVVPRVLLNEKYQAAVNSVQELQGLMASGATK